MRPKTFAQALVQLLFIAPVVITFAWIRFCIRVIPLLPAVYRALRIRRGLRKLEEYERAQRQA